LEEDGISGEATMHALLILGILNDTNIIFINEKLIRILVDILTNDASSELSEMCLELLHSQTSNGELMII